MSRYVPVIDKSVLEGFKNTLKLIYMKNLGQTDITFTKEEVVELIISAYDDGCSGTLFESSRILESYKNIKKKKEQEIKKEDLWVVSFIFAKVTMMKGFVTENMLTLVSSDCESKVGGIAYAQTTEKYPKFKNMEWALIDQVVLKINK